MKDLSNSSNNIPGPNPLEGFHVIDERGDIFKQVFRYSIIPTLIHDMDMNILDANHKALEEFGYSMEELKTIKIFDLHVEEELNRSAEVLEQMKRENKLSVETKFRRKDGSVFNAEATPCKYILEGKPLIHVFIQDITERKKAIKKIQEFNKLLENEVARRTTDLLIKNDELESFNYSVTHDLRAPLRVVEGYAQILKEDHSKTLNPEGQKFLDLIIKNTAKMEQLIKDVLKMSKLSHEELTLEEINIKRLFEEVFEELTHSMDSRTINFRVDNLPNCIADRSMIKQLVTNLLSNALKYTSTRKFPKIHVSNIIIDGESAYTVQDNGVGFSMKYYNKLFTAFERLHNKGDFEGSGIGLSIAHKVIELHHGKIWADSELGKGTTFYFTLHGKDQEFFNKEQKE